jgi:hypothetical protein
MRSASPAFPGQPTNTTGMIGPLLHRLSEGADTRSLADWISRERSSHFGLEPDRTRDMELAEWLTAW